MMSSSRRSRRRIWSIWRSWKERHIFYRLTPLSQEWKTFVFKNGKCLALGSLSNQPKKKKKVQVFLCRTDGASDGTRNFAKGPSVSLDKSSVASLFSLFFLFFHSDSFLDYFISILSSPSLPLSHSSTLPLFHWSTTSCPVTTTTETAAIYSVDVWRGHHRHRRRLHPQPSSVVDSLCHFGNGVKPLNRSFFLCRHTWNYPFFFKERKEIESFVRTNILLVASVVYFHCRDVTIGVETNRENAAGYQRHVRKNESKKEWEQERIRKNEKGKEKDIGCAIDSASFLLGQ